MDNNIPQWEEKFNHNWETDSSGLGKWAGMSTGYIPHYDSHKIKGFIRQTIKQIIDDIPDESDCCGCNNEPLKNKLIHKYL